MRPVLILALLAVLSGCASDEYSSVPDASGEWVPANPPSPGTPPRAVMRAASSGTGDTP